MIIDELRRAFFQIIIMIIIPFIWWVFWWFVTKNSKYSFFEWVGLKKPVINNKKVFIVFIFLTFVIGFSMSLVLDPLLPDDIQLANERFGGQGIKVILPAIIFSFLATSLPEEIFFRGFLGKKLIRKTGFIIGNTIQSLIFGLLHGATMIPALGIVIPLLVIFFTGLLGWFMGLINEKANGSILPSWCIHGISNLYASIIIMFNLL